MSGFSVLNGVEVPGRRKIILLEKDLEVLNDGVIEGRRSFANIHEVHNYGHELKLR